MKEQAKAAGVRGLVASALLVVGRGVRGAGIAGERPRRPGAEQRWRWGHGWCARRRECGTRGQRGSAARLAGGACWSASR